MPSHRLGCCAGFVFPADGFLAVVFEAGRLPDAFPDLPAGSFFKPRGLVDASGSGLSAGAEIARALPARRALGVVFGAGFFGSVAFVVETGFTTAFDRAEVDGFEEAVVFLDGVVLVGAGFTAALGGAEAAFLEEAVVFLAGVALAVGTGLAVAPDRVDLDAFVEAAFLLAGVALVVEAVLVEVLDPADVVGFAAATVFDLDDGFGTDARARERRVVGEVPFPGADPAISQVMLRSTSESPAFRSTTLLPAATRV